MLADPAQAKLLQRKEPSQYAFVLALQCQTRDLPLPVAEYRFDKTRRWRFDFAWPEKKIALEVEGGCWIRGRHNRGSGYLKDLEKYNAAAAQGLASAAGHAATTGDARDAGLAGKNTG